MWISKKKLNVLEKRIADLEDKTQSQQKGLKANWFEIHEIEKRYINSEDSLIQIRVELPGRDWCELSSLPCWKEVEMFLNQKKNKDTQNLRTAAGG